jgi:hypothetical protein
MRSLTAVALSTLALAAAGLPAARPSTPAPLDLRAYRAVDLTHAFDDKTLYWPNSPSRFELKTLHRGPTDGGYFYSAYALCTPEQGERTSTRRCTSRRAAPPPTRCRSTG